MKKVKQVNGYAIYQAATQRDADNYGCQVGNFNIYIAQDIRDFGLVNNYPEYEDVDSLAAAIAYCSGSRYAVAVALADELNDSTVQDMDLVLEIEHRLDAGDALNTVRRCYDRENGILYSSISDAIDHGFDPYAEIDFDPYEDHPAMARDEDGKLHVIEDDDDLADDDLSDDELDGDLEDVLDAALSAGDRADQNLDYDYQETELLCRAMRAAGYGYLGTDHDGELLHFTDDSLQDLVFTDWPEVREWLEYVVFDDPDVSDAVERVLHPERFAHEQEHRSHASYYVVETCDSDCQWLTIAPARPAELTDDQYRNLFFRKVAERIAFDDCSDEQVNEIVFDGEPCHYTGWQPGMVIEFASDITGEIVYSGSFPEWDH